MLGLLINFLELILLSACISSNFLSMFIVFLLVSGYIVDKKPFM